MVTRFLVRAQDCLAIDPQRITEAGGRLLAIGRIEEDGTVTVDVDVEDLETNRRLGALFAAAGTAEIGGPAPFGPDAEGDHRAN